MTMPHTYFLSRLLFCTRIGRFTMRISAFTMRSLRFDLFGQHDSFILRRFRTNFTARRIFTLFRHTSAASIRAGENMRFRHIAANDNFQIARRRAGFRASLISRSRRHIKLLRIAHRLARHLTRRAYHGTRIEITSFTFSFHFQHRYHRKIGSSGICYTEAHRNIASFRYLLTNIQLKTRRIVSVSTRFAYMS